MGLNDFQIKDLITKRAEFDSRIDNSLIVVEVSHGRVRLTGTIPSFSQKRELSLLAWDEKSVKSVDNQLEITAPVPENACTDDMVASNAITALKNNSSTSQHDPQISVKNSVVTISGVVDSMEGRKKVESVVGDLSGVKDVVNLLTVVPSQHITDEIIARAITESFKQNHYIEEAKIRVIVTEGNVTLQGKVFSAKTAFEAYESASRVIGVRDINNEIIWN